MVNAITATSKSVTTTVTVTTFKLATAVAEGLQPILFPQAPIYHERHGQIMHCLTTNNL